jgi:hypothetical protein
MMIHLHPLSAAGFLDCVLPSVQDRPLPLAEPEMASMFIDRSLMIPRGLINPAVLPIPDAQLFSIRASVITLSTIVMFTVAGFGYQRKLP